jgi:hypothetical protein
MGIADDQQQQLRVRALKVLSNCLTEHELGLVSARSNAFTKYLQKALPLLKLWSEVTLVQPDSSAARLQQLVAIRRHADQITIPACVDTAHQHLLAALEAVIRVAAAQMTDDDTVTQSAQAYVVSIRAFYAELRRESQQIAALFQVATTR